MGAQRRWFAGNVVVLVENAKGTCRRWSSLNKCPEARKQGLLREGQTWDTGLYRALPALCQKPVTKGTDSRANPVPGERESAVPFGGTCLNNTGSGTCPCASASCDLHSAAPRESRAAALQGLPVLGLTVCLALMKGTQGSWDVWTPHGISSQSCRQAR